MALKYKYVVTVPAKEGVTLEQWVAFAEHYNCTVVRLNKRAKELTLSCNELIDFFWLFNNWNNDYINHLLKTIQDLQK